MNRKIVFSLIAVVFLVMSVSVLSAYAADSGFYTRMNSFINDDRWKNGISWGDSQRPKSTTYDCASCYAYAADFAHEVWSSHPLSFKYGEQYTSPLSIAVGDVVRLHDPNYDDNHGNHYYVVLGRYADGSLWTIEGNYNHNGFHRVWESKTRYSTSSPGSSSKPFVCGYHMPDYTPYYSDPEPPVISNVRVSNINRDGYTVTCDVSDNKGVAQVRFPTWTVPGDQDDLVWADGSISGGTASFRVNVSDHGDQRDCDYVTHIYAYDIAGNQAVANTDQYAFLQVYVPATNPEEHYTITLDATGGNINQSSLPVTLNASDYFDLSWNLPTRDGYRFDGWYTSSSGGTQVYNSQGYCTNEGQYWSNNFYVYPGNVTLYAHWTLIASGSYTITLDPNGGTVSHTSLPVTLNASDYYEISWCLPTREGYAFDGWYTSPTDGTQVYNSQGYCTNEGQYWSNNFYVYPGNVTLYAHWTVLTPASNVVSVTSSDCFHETVITWTSVEYADRYDVYISTGDLSSIIYRAIGADGFSFRALLPAGNYQAFIAPVNTKNHTWSNSNYVPFTVESRPTPTAGSLVSCREADHRLYAVYDKTCNWLEAEAIAASSIGDFASITSQSAQVAVADAVQEFGYPVWLGAESYRNKEWQWVNGDDFYYTNWNAGEPNSSYGDENTLHMLATGEWNDHIATSDIGNEQFNIRGYVLQYEPASILAIPPVHPYMAGHEFTKDELYVEVVFENGTTIETADYTLEQSGTEGGTQTLTITYGPISETIEVELVPDPDFILPASLTAIEEEAFMGIDAQVVEVPDGCASIGARAFADCPNLKYVIVSDLNAIDIADDAIEGTNAVIIEK